MLIILSGPALTGKSTFLGLINKEIKILNIISTDDIRMELYRSYDFKPEREKEIWDLTYHRIEDLLNRGSLVALDATLRSIENRGAIVNRFKHIPIVYIAFEKPELQVLLERNRTRKWKQFPEEAILKMFHDYQFPTEIEKTYYLKVFDVPFAEYSDKIRIITDWLIKNYGS
jgi:predicted kinase